VINRLQGVSEFSGVAYETLARELLELYDTQFIRTDISLATEQDKLNYCSKILKMRYLFKSTKREEG
jgi:hypothetical protein